MSDAVVGTVRATGGATGGAAMEAGWAMSEAQWRQATPEALARLMGAEGAWSKRDQTEALRQLLEAPAMEAMGALPGAERERLEAMLRRLGKVMSVRELLHHGEAPRELLDAVKQYGRFASGDAANPLGPEGGRVIYFAAIAAFLVHSRGTKAERLEGATRLEVGQVREGMRWAMQQAGGEAVRGLLEAGLGLLES